MSSVNSSAGAVRQGEGKVLIPDLVVLKASGSQTGGAFEVLEVRGPGGPPPHVHHSHHELFHVLDGVFRFTVAGDAFDLGPDSFVLVPPGTRHNFEADPGSRAVLFVAPAGLEGFFADLGAGMAAGKSDDEIRRELEGKYDQHPA